VFHGTPQWQIQALRRLEIPDDLQDKNRGMSRSMLKS
jgi:hypothetical protein